MNRLRAAIVLPLLAMLSGCNAVVLHPAGDVALQQRNLLLEATGLMLLIIIPVMALTALFAWRYRESNKKACYDPDWDHSTQLELVIWGAPLLIIICLGAMTWMGSHLLDPYRPIGRVAAGRPIAKDATPLEVQIVALDWKWLFIYPQYGVAAVNELAAPVDRPIDFQITSSSVMNSFYIPALAGQIYAMPGMEAKLHAVINKPGDYQGFSANYSGAGFSGMHFTFTGLASADFDRWIAKAKSAGGSLDRNTYLELERPSQNEPTRTYAAADKGLYDAILNMCVQPGKMCSRDMMAIDARGGLGLAGISNLLPFEYDKFTRRGTAFGPKPTSVASLCTPAAPTGVPDEKTRVALDFTPVRGAGLPRPSILPIRLPWSSMTSRSPDNS